MENEGSYINEHQARKQMKAEARLRWIRAVESGQIKCLDRFGNELTAGSKVLFHPAVDLFMDVVSVQANLRSDQEPGFMTVTLSVSMPLQVPCNAPWPLAILMATQEQPADQPLRATRQDVGDESEVLIGGHLASVDVDNPQEG